MDREAFQIAITMKITKHASRLGRETRLQPFKRDRKLICDMEFYRNSKDFWDEKSPEGSGPWDTYIGDPIMQISPATASASLAMSDR